MKLLFAAIFFFASSSAFSQMIFYISLFDAGLKGKVKNITFEEYESQTDTKGELVMARVNGFKYKKIHHYNQAGQLERYDIFRREDSNSEVVHTHFDEYKYEEGRLIARIGNDLMGQLHDPNYIGIVEEYIYDNDSVILHHSRTEPEDIVKYSSYRYTISDKKFKSERLDHKLLPVDINTYYLDDSGQKICIIHESKGIIMDSTVYCRSDADYGILETVTHYNFKSDNKIVSYNKLTPQGDLIQTEYPNQEAGKKNFFNYKYVYDNNQNWLEKLEYNSEGKLMKIYRRNIEYWKE